MGRGGVIIAGLAIGGLLASGCSSGGSGGTGSPRSAGSAGSPGSPASPAAATVATESVRVGRLTEIFDGPLPADPAQASVVEGFRAALIVWDKSQEEQKLVSPVTSDVTGAALTNLRKSLTQELTPGQQIVPAGTDRNFDTRVTALSGASATVTTCDDGSKFDEVNSGYRGGQYGLCNATPDQGIHIRHVAADLGQLNGQWAISVVTPVTLPNALAKPCQP